LAKMYGLFFNNNSGDGKGKKIAEDLHKLLSKQHISDILITGKDADDAIEKVKQTLPQIDVLVIIGGDGSINLAMTAMIQTNADLPVGIVPAGTVNNFAKRYSIPLNIDESLQLIAGQHSTRRVGIAVCNKTKAIVSSLTFGNLADISNEVRQEEKRKFGKIVYLFKAVKHIGKNKSIEIRFSLDNSIDEVMKTWFALITTTKSIGGHVYDDSSPDKMHISLLHNIGLRQVLPYLFFALTGHLKNSKSIDHFEAKHAEIKSVNNQTIQTRIDGDESINLPIQIEYRRNRIELFIDN
jgi:diacylglycerol kinase (ATP)